VLRRFGLFASCEGRFGAIGPQLLLALAALRPREDGDMPSRPIGERYQRLAKHLWPRTK